MNNVLIPVNDKLVDQPVYGVQGTPRRRQSRTARQSKTISPRGRQLPAVVILGGGTNALSIARSLGRRGVTVYSLNEPTAQVNYSRYCHRIPLIADANPKTSESAWVDYLLGRDSDHLRGAVLLSASDLGIELIARHRELLQEKFLLDESHAPAQLCMLNKLCTYRAAVAAGVPTPRFWVANSMEQIERLRDELVYPLIVKPQFSHRFEHALGDKFLVAKKFEELRAAMETMQEAAVDVLLVEQIPGPDSQLCSYYTYLDSEGHALFDFTKRIIRRFPKNMGAACYHITDQNPEVREISLRLFRHVGLQGLANAEFKFDPRDGQLKLIECNARFTAANGLVARAGLDLARFVYHRIVGLAPVELSQYRTGVRLWYPLEDWKAFRQLHRQGELSWCQWLGSLAHFQTMPCFDWMDPAPTLISEFQRASRIARKFIKAILRVGRKAFKAG